MRWCRVASRYVDGWWGFLYSKTVLVSWLLGFKVSWFLDFLVPWCFGFQSFLVSKLQSFQVSMITYYQNSISCVQEDIDPIPRLSKNFRTDLHNLSVLTFSIIFKTWTSANETSNNNMFLKGIPILLELLEVSWCLKR